MDRVDVLLPVREPAPWLPETLSSLVRQTDAEWHLVCTIPRDSLHLRDVIRGYVPEATLIEIPNDLTFPATLNVGISNCYGEYIIRIDQDDVAVPTRIAEQVYLLRTNPNVAVVCSPVTLIDGLTTEYGSAFHVHSEQLPKKMLLKNWVAHPTVALRRSVLGKKPYDERALNGEDYEVWLRLLTQHEIWVMDHPILHYRRHPGQMSALNIMDAEGRKLIRRRRAQLARARNLSRLRVIAGNLTWTTVQLARGVQRGLYRRYPAHGVND